MQVRAPPPRCAPRAWCTRRAEPVRTLGFLETMSPRRRCPDSRINTAPVSCLLGSLSTGGWGLGDRALSRCPARDPYGACLTHTISYEGIRVDTNMNKGDNFTCNAYLGESRG